MHKKIRLKPISLYMIYGILTISFVIGIMVVGNIMFKVDKITYVTSGTLTEDIIPVISEKKVFIKPYTDENIQILQNYYDYKGNKDIQEKSLILYENTYLQNSGVDYGNDNIFDVVAIYDGTVLDVSNDDILGKIIEVQHTNNLIAYYECLGDTKVKKDDYISQGQIIATSGTCNISKNIGNHLHLEIANNGKIINPESIYEKTIEEIQ